VPEGERRGRAVSLRGRLLLLVIVAIVPLAFMAGTALLALLGEQRRQSEQASIDLTRALGTAVETELRLTVSALQSLAALETTPGGAVPQPDTLHDLARQVLVTRPEWLAVILADPQGRVVFNTSLPPGATPNALIEPESFRTAVQTRQPTIGPLARGPAGRDGIPVRVPVIENGELHFILTAVVKPEAILNVISRQRVPPDWIVSVFDARNQRVARSRDHSLHLGEPPTPSLVELQQRHVDEGAGVTITLEGERVYTAFSRLRAIGWTVAIGLPVETADEGAQRSTLVYGGGILLSLGIGMLGAWRVARGIARPIGQLGEAADAIGRGEAPTHQAAGIAEIEAASQALVTASRRREEAEAEREKLLVAERQARAVAERAQQRLEVVAGAGERLSRSLEEKTTLESIAGVIVPAVADWCRIDLLDEHGKLQRKLTHHADPERRAAVEQFVQTGRVARDAPGSFPQVIASGVPFCANFDSPEDSGISDPTFLAFARLTGMRATCVVPLVARGRTIGAMGAIQAESGRRFGPEDAVLIHELAQRAALALDNVRLFAEAEQALREAEVANRAKDEFLAMLGHELRNPLAPIVSSLELMARRAPEALEAQRRVIERQVAHLSALVDDLLDVSRIVSGKVRLALERVDLRDVVGRAFEAALPAFAARTRAPELALPAAPVWVHGDAVRLTQVVGNLLANAAKFTRSDDRITVELATEEGTARLSVADEGIGMTPELLEKVFERFVQGEQALQRATGGLGLGLAIARSLVELHHGTITAESAGPGRGSRFIVTLPLASAQADAPAELPAATRAPVRGGRVLVVDDNTDAAEAVAALLQLEGYAVRIAESAEEALAAIAVDVPDAALLDIGLPRMDGYALARALRADPRSRGMRLIALTGYGRSPDRRNALEAGFDEHLVKPVDVEALLARLDALVHGEARSPSA
jgi:signal transduction histidine kinase/ActR/RegA family two-component response regulator